MDQEGNIVADETVKFNLPRMIRGNDYHEFRRLSYILQAGLGISGVYVTEVGFDGNYVGLIHMNTSAHRQLVRELIDRYSTME